MGKNQIRKQMIEGVKMLFINSICKKMIYDKQLIYVVSDLCSLQEDFV